MNSGNPLVVALEIGGTKLQAALGRADGTILDRRRAEVDRGGGAPGILDWTMARATELFKAAEGRGGVAALGIGFGGPVESDTGRVLVSHQIAGWEDVLLKSVFESRFKVPVVVANDANAAGWAEYCLGAGKGTRQFVYMNIGSGIGGALIMNGQLYDGQGRGACEIGHTWTPDWTSARPGAADKLENLCSGWAIERRLRALDYLEPGTPLHDGCGGDAQRLTCAMLGDAARKGDATASGEIKAIAQAIGLALGNVVALFHPERIALGGGVSLMGETLFAPIRAALERHCFGPYRGMTQVVPCALEEDVVVVGALLLAGAYCAQ